MSEMLKGIGVHVFAGGFTMGIKRVLPVIGQLEIHNFGRETCERHGTPFMNADTWESWDDYHTAWKGCRFCYGNPRCTAFSSYSSGASDRARGPTAAPTQDIWGLCRFGVHADLDLVAFESVQQAYTVGRPLLDRLRDELFAPRHYRIAHVFVNTAAEGNAQCRRRYFFVAYRDDRNFNVYRPDLPELRTTVGDVLGRRDLVDRDTNERHLYGAKNVDYDSDSYERLSPDEKTIVPHLGEGECFNIFAKKHTTALEKISPKHHHMWTSRVSELPFSLHSPRRLEWDGTCPTIASTSTRFIHPRVDRPLTVGEIAALMGWPDGFIPSGPAPIAQIGKGVVPATGEWLAQQVLAYFDDDWGDDDFESSYCHCTKTWFGKDHSRAITKPIEKEFRLTYYLPPFREKVAR